MGAHRRLRIRLGSCECLFLGAIWMRLGSKGLGAKRNRDVALGIADLRALGRDAMLRSGGHE